MDRIVRLSAFLELVSSIAIISVIECVSELSLMLTAHCVSLIITVNYVMSFVNQLAFSGILCNDVGEHICGNGNFQPPPNVTPLCPTFMVLLVT